MDVLVETLLDLFNTAGKEQKTYILKSNIASQILPSLWSEECVWEKSVQMSFTCYRRQIKA